MAGLCVELAEMPLSGGVHRGAAQQPADGLLRPRATGGRCARAWGGGAACGLSLIHISTDPLAAEFFAGKTLDAEDQRRLTDRLSALASRRRAADAVKLYETLRERDIPVPLWAERDIAGSYLELRRPQEALSRYRQVVAANPDDFDANLGLFYALVETEQLDAATEHIDRLSLIHI